MQVKHRNNNNNNNTICSSLPPAFTPSVISTSLQLFNTSYGQLSCIPCLSFCGCCKVTPAESAMMPRSQVSFVSGAVATIPWGLPPHLSGNGLAICVSHGVTITIIIICEPTCCVSRQPFWTPKNFLSDSLSAEPTPRLFPQLTELWLQRTFRPLHSPSTEAGCIVEPRVSCPRQRSKDCSDCCQAPRHHLEISNRLGLKM